MEVADDTKFRIELISMTEKSGQDNVVEGTDASDVWDVGKEHQLEM